MRQFFKNHPIITYNGQQVRNIFLTAKLTKQALGDTLSLLPYTVQEGETPTTVAYDYYGSVDYTWLVLFSNNILDPYTQWVKTEEQFHEHLIKVYGSVESTYKRIHAYRNITEPEIQDLDNPLPLVTPTTYEHMPPVEEGKYEPVYLYD